jgi:phosphoribosylamine--glycine ligase
MVSTTGGGITVSEASPEEVDADLFVIGPEAPLVDGLGDRLRARGALVFGPGADGAALEGSKVFMKEVLTKAHVKTALYEVFSTPRVAHDYVTATSGPWVIKTDGLAAGKGVLVTSTRDEALADVAAKLSGEAFGDAGRHIVIEEALDGTECSLLFLVDGKDAVALVPSQDHKRLFDNDAGPNTGGMGTFAPVPWIDAAFVDSVKDDAVLPVLSELTRRGIDYRGVLYAGLMMTEDGPSVLEYNVRFGDPEAQVVFPLFATDLAQWLFAAASGNLASVSPNVDNPPVLDGHAVCVVMASKEYPHQSSFGEVIEGLGANGQLYDEHEGVFVYHAGTKREGNRFVTNGGRVLGVTGIGATNDKARERAYGAVSSISFGDGSQVFRSDIADYGCKAERTWS